MFYLGRKQEKCFEVQGVLKKDEESDTSSRKLEADIHPVSGAFPGMKVLFWEPSGQARKYWERQRFRWDLKDYNSIFKPHQNSTEGCEKCKENKSSSRE